MKKSFFALSLVVLLCGLAFASETDTQLQAIYPGWHNHVGCCGVGGVPPEAYPMTQITGPPVTPAAFYVEGIVGDECNVLWYVSRPVMTNTGNLSLSYNLRISSGVQGSAQALERDTKLTLSPGQNQPTLTSNFSFQLLVNYQGQNQVWDLEVNDQSGGWQSIGYTIPALTPNVLHSFVLTYSFDLAAKTYSYISINIDGDVYPVPSNLQNQTMAQIGWSTGAIFQFQQDVQPAGGSYTETVTNATYTWW